MFKGKSEYMFWEVLELPNYHQTGVFLGVVQEFIINRLVQL
jgi:hypothetical protein